MTSSPVVVGLDEQHTTLPPESPVNRRSLRSEAINRLDSLSVGRVSEDQGEVRIVV